MNRSDDETIPLERALGRKAMAVLCAGVFGVAIVGFSIGIRKNTDVEPRGMPGISSNARASSSAGQAPEAPSYLELATRSLSPNARFTSSLAALAQPADSPPPAKPDPDERARALLRRAARRAYDGAPPVVPHATDARSAAACLACHGEGLVVEGLVARKIPHPPWSQCTQCHVEAQNPSFDDLVLAESAFSGFVARDFAHRAAPGAPPLTPHGTTVRQDCLACHGSRGELGLRTSHPERQNCLQCHPSTTDLDFRAPSDGVSFLPPPRIEGESP
jgi:cytochrome c-type protein NapB